MSADSRTVHPARRALLTTLGALVAFSALLWVAPPSTVLHQITHLQVGWVLAAVALELGSCCCYPVIFRRFFPEPPPRTGCQVAWISMGAGAVLPGGNISSAAATGWLLRGHGIATGRLLARCGALLCLLTLFGFFVNGFAAALLLVRVPGGPHDIAHTMGPILVSAVVLGAAWMISTVSRRLGRRSPLVLRGVATALDGAYDAVRHPHWRLLGGAGFLLLDMGALWAACEATGRPIGMPALVIGYCIGYLATIVPIPAGLGVLDTGLAAALVLYGMNPAASVGAVLVYHAISIWVPGAGGLVAWLPTRAARRREGVAARLPDLPLAQVSTVVDAEL